MSAIVVPLLDNSGLSFSGGSSQKGGTPEDSANLAKVLHTEVQVLSASVSSSAIDPYRDVLQILARINRLAGNLSSK